MKKQVTVYYNATLVNYAMFWGLFTPTIYGLGTLLFSVPQVIDLWVCSFLLLLIFGCLAAMNSHHVTLTKDGVKYGKWFKQSASRCYEDYPYVYMAYYLNRGIKAYCMVFSTEKIRNARLTSINKEKFGPDLICIRYNKKNYDRLMQSSRLELQTVWKSNSRIFQQSAFIGCCECGTSV